MSSTNSVRRFIISGGGTGGHIYPAIAIANTIKERLPDADILFVGALGRMEMTKVPEAGYRIIGLDIMGLQRKLTLQNLRFPFKVFKSVRAARQILRDFTPDAVIGVGGYASAPLVYAATAMGIPVLVQEQNSYAGLTNKLLGKRADVVCVAYDAMYQYFPAGKVVKTGNPVRKDLKPEPGKRAEAQAYFKLNLQKKTLLVLGGSLGARTLNQAMQQGLEKLTSNGLQVIWQCGKTYYATAKTEVNNQPNVQVFEFISRMDLAYAAADIVVSRAGALSVSELCLTGKPAILVPSPNVAEDHQTKNARSLADKQAALLVTDAEAPQKLISEAIALASDIEQQQLLSKNISALARPAAADHIVDELFKLI